MSSSRLLSPAGTVHGQHTGILRHLPRDCRGTGIPEKGFVFTLSVPSASCRLYPLHFGNSTAVPFPVFLPLLLYVRFSSRNPPCAGKLKSLPQSTIRNQLLSGLIYATMKRIVSSVQICSVFFLFFPRFKGGRIPNRRETSRLFPAFSPGSPSFPAPCPARFRGSRGPSCPDI